MKEEKWYKSPKFYKRVTIILFGISILMIVLYFVFTGSNLFSNDSDEWADFGQYFGSITGLLAFAGVLYSAALSEERANRAEDEMKIREERDQFFKLLDLFQKNSQELTIKNDSNTEILHSIFAFEYIKTKINRYLIFELIKIFINELNDEKYKLLLSNQLNTTLKYHNFYANIIEMIRETHQEVKKIPRDGIFDHTIDIEEFKNEGLKSPILYQKLLLYINLSINRKAIDHLFSDTDIILDNTKIFNAITSTTSYVFEEKGTRLDIFCNTFKGILSTIQKFKYNDNYYSLIHSQLSRDQLVLLFVYSFSRFSNNDFVEKLLKSKILYELDLADLVIFKSEEYLSKEVLWKAIEDLHKYYLED